MLCVEDALDTLNWVDSLGGLNNLIKRSDQSLEHISNWISKSTWAKFLNHDEKTRSNTGITFTIVEDWFLNKDNDKQREVIKKINSLLDEEKVAKDINGYPKAPPSFRIWGGGTVEPEDIKDLLPWMDWAFYTVKNQYA